MEKLNSGDFLVIQKWFYDSLGLDGSRERIYAIIYNISKDGRSTCQCTQEYFIDWTHTTDRTVRNDIKFLTDVKFACESGKMDPAPLVFRNEVGKGPGSYSEYAVNLEIVALARMGEKFSPIIIQENRCNNTGKSLQEYRKNFPPKKYYKSNNKIFFSRVTRTREAFAEEEKKNLYVLFYFRNATDPVAEVSAFCRTAELDGWTDAKGRKLESPEKRLLWAEGWDLRGRDGRSDKTFLESWKQIYNLSLVASESGASWAGTMVDRMLDPRISVSADGQGLILSLPDDVRAALWQGAVENGDIKNAMMQYLSGRDLRYRSINSKFNLCQVTM